MTRLDGKDIRDGKLVLTVTSKFLWWERVSRYEATEESPKGYWNWLKLPNRTLVSDSVSFQLDAWCRP